MKAFIPFGLIAIFILSYGIVISQFRPPVLSEELKSENKTGYYDYRGVTNSHTSLNKGSLPPKEVIKEAIDAQLDFLLLTDLNVFSPYPVEREYYDNTLVIPADVYSYLDAHLVYFHLDQKPSFSGLGDVQIFMSDRFSKKKEEISDDFVILAHPFKGRTNWRGDYPETLQGLEIINLKSVWRQAWKKTKASFFWSVFIYPFNSHLALLRIFQTPEKELKLWDELNQKKPTIGFVGNETTSRQIPIGKNLLRFPSYKTSFEIASNHVLLQSELTGNAERDRKKILKALKNGQFYMSLDYLENPKGFVTYLRKGKKKYPLGSQLEIQKGLELYVHLPRPPQVPFEVVIYRDGKPIFRSHKEKTIYPIKKAGVYRITVRVIPTMPLPDGKKWISWIYTNPFFVR